MFYMRTGGRADGRTDMTTLILAFRNFANAPKNNGSDFGERITFQRVSAFRIYIYIYIYTHTSLSWLFFSLLFLV